LAILVAVVMMAPWAPLWSAQVEWFEWSDEPDLVSPVPAAVVDGFRLPEFNWLPGNRGLEFATASGDVAVAPAAGLVTFAGSVGGSKHVTIRFSPTRRATVSFLEQVDVKTGDTVVSGQQIGLSAPGLHLTVRTNTGRYLDPRTFFDPRTPRVRLVPLIS